MPILKKEVHLPEAFLASSLEDMPFQSGFSACRLRLCLSFYFFTDHTEAFEKGDSCKVRFILSFA
jgi:hypothetical protein